MKAWSYILVYSDRLGTREEVTGFLDSSSRVTYWYYCLPNCIFFTSTLGAVALAELVQEQFGKGAMFLISEIHEDRQGWLPPTAWHLFRNPTDPRMKE